MKDHIKSEIWAWFSVFLIMSFLLMTLNDRFPNLLGIEIENEHLGICGLIILIVASMHILS